MTTSEILPLAVGGDADAYGELYKTHRDRIFSLILTLVRNHQDAEDLTQETFILGWRSICRFKFKSGFHTWIHRIAYNRTMGFFQSNKSSRRPQLSFVENVSSVENGGESGLKAVAREEWTPSLRLQLRELMQELERAIALLPAAQFTAIQPLIDGEVADLTKRTNIFLARQKLRKHLAASGVI